jgi:hypothetical protein
MPSRSSRRACAIAGALALLTLAVPAADARAGEFQVATCQADSLGFTTRPFEDFATRGMQIRRACNPEGRGLRGLITANVIRRGRLPRGARAIVTLNAPAGTRFTRFRWAGTARRRDCRYALQLYADGPDIAAIPIKNVRANRACPRPRRAQAAQYQSRTFNVTGATRIVQRVICVGGGGRRSCSARAKNFIRTYKAIVGVTDAVPPTAGILHDTPLARGQWVGGATQPINYDANDNVGVRLATAFVGGLQPGLHNRPCLLATPQGPYAHRVPCPNGPGQITIDTRKIPDGAHALVVQAQDAAGNVASSGVLTARIDNTPPPRVDVRLAGAEGWRSEPGFVLNWTNPPEPDRAPIVAATSRLCTTRGQACRTTVHNGLNLSRLGVTVPGPGEWRLSVWRRDAAGNEADDNASVPVTLRYDPEAPQLAFEPPPAADPTLVAVRVTDRVSGMAGGSIEIGPAGSGSWQTLATERQGDRLIARIDDAALPAGMYALRARAADHAGNQGFTDRRGDGQPMVVTLPLRTVTTLLAGVEHRRIVRRTVRRDGKRRQVRRPITELRPTGRVRLGAPAHVAGRLTDRTGNGIAGAQIQVLARTESTPEQPVGVVHTGADGGYRYTTTGTSTRTLRLVYPGSALTLPTQAEVGLRVPAESSIRVSRRRVLNGRAVRFTGRVRSAPIPAAGKLIELQVQLSGRWQTFRTRRTDSAGRWAVPYQFRRTRGVQRYRFRLRLPREAGYPFEPGSSRSLTVRVRGR